MRVDLARFGVAVEDFYTARVSWNTFWDYVSEILREPSSHLVAAMNGDKYVTEASERAIWNVFELWLNSQRKSGRKPLKRPWAGTSPSYKETVADVTPDRERRRAKLDALF